MPEFVPVAGSSSARDVITTTGSPMIDSSSEAVETLSEYTFPARQESEIAQEPFRPLKPMQKPRFSQAHTVNQSNNFFHVWCIDHKQY